MDTQQATKYHDQFCDQQNKLTSGCFTRSRCNRNAHVYFVFVFQNTHTHTRTHTSVYTFDLSCLIARLAKLWSFWSAFFPCSVFPDHVLAKVRPSAEGSRIARPAPSSASETNKFERSNNINELHRCFPDSRCGTRDTSATYTHCLGRPSDSESTFCNNFRLSWLLLLPITPEQQVTAATVAMVVFKLSLIGIQLTLTFLPELCCFAVANFGYSQRLLVCVFAFIYYFRFKSCVNFVVNCTTKPCYYIKMLHFLA